jgi:hypothetical protein
MHKDIIADFQKIPEPHHRLRGLLGGGDRRRQY